MHLGPYTAVDGEIEPYWHQPSPSIGCVPVAPRLRPPVGCIHCSVREWKIWQTQPSHLRTDPSDVAHPHMCGRSF